MSKANLFKTVGISEAKLCQVLRERYDEKSKFMKKPILMNQSLFQAING